MSDDHQNGFLSRAFEDAAKRALESVKETVDNIARDIKLRNALKYGTITLIEDDVKEVHHE